MMRLTMLAGVLLVGCGGDRDVVEDSDSQPELRFDFEDVFPPDGLNLVDHSTDGGTWSHAEVSAWGEGSGAAELGESTDNNAAEAGVAGIGIEAVDLVEPAELLLDVAFPLRPYNSPQRLEVLLIGERDEVQLDFELEELTDVMLSSGDQAWTPQPEDWFTLTVPVEPEVLGAEVQVTLRISADYSGLRPPVFVDNIVLSAVARD